MITSCLFLLSFGFYLFYYTSKRLRFTQLNRFQNWVTQNTIKAKWLGLLALLISANFLCLHLGLAGGCFFFAVSLMAIASLEILFLPIGLFRWLYVLPLTLFIFLIEAFI